MTRLLQSQFDRAGIPAIPDALSTARHHETRLGFRGKGRVILWGLMIFLFSAVPSWAEPTGAEPTSEYWTRSCNKNLEKTLNLEASAFHDFETFSLKRLSDFSRAVGAQHAHCINQLISTAETMDKKEWPETAKQYFLPELIWVQNLLKDDVAEIYRQARKSKVHRDNVDARILAMLLLSWAVDKEYPPAVFDRAQEYFKKNNPPNTLAWAILEGSLRQGYLPALLDAAKRRLKGDSVKKNLGKAFYWLKRAEAAGGDVSAILEKPHERLFQEMNQHDVLSLLLLIDTYGDLDWTNIKVPDIKKNSTASPTLTPLASLALLKLLLSGGLLNF